MLCYVTFCYIYICTYICVYVYIYIYTDTYMCIYVYIYMYITYYIYIYTMCFRAALRRQVANYIDRRDGASVPPADPEAAHVRFIWEF